MAAPPVGSTNWRGSGTQPRRRICRRLRAFHRCVRSGFLTATSRSIRRSQRALSRARKHYRSSSSRRRRSEPALAAPRGFTAEECAQFIIERCPTLDQMRSVVPARYGQGASWICDSRDRRLGRKRRRTRPVTESAWSGAGSNCRPPVFQTGALPTELPDRTYARARADDPGVRCGGSDGI